jgi:hypothetical protein
VRKDIHFFLPLEMLVVVNRSLNLAIVIQTITLWRAKMRRLAVVSAVVGVMLVVNAAWAEDYNPPPWRGGENTTSAQWLFNDASYDLVAPDVFSSNPTLAAGTFSIEYDPPDTVWLSSWNGASGVWRLESPSNITMEIPNFDNDGLQKEIWMQLTYIADGAGEPFIYTDPLFSGEVTTSDPVADGLYWNITYHIIIEPNPASETIWIQPLDCTLYLDQIVIDTICTVPEPATICLFGLGALALLRKRKR